MHAEYIQEIELGSELLWLHFTILGIEQVTLFGCKSLGFVIYNQFYALVSPELTFPFLQFVSCPKGPRSIPLLYQSSHSPSSANLALSDCLLPIPLHMHCRGCQVCPSCASSGNCLQWYIISETQEPHTLAELSQPPLKCLAHDVKYYTPTEQVSDPALTNANCVSWSWSFPSFSCKLLLHPCSKKQRNSEKNECKREQNCDLNLNLENWWCAKYFQQLQHTSMHKCSSWQ